MATSTVENYLKQIYALQFDRTNRSSGTVNMGKLASTLGVAPGTATSMIKALARSGEVDYVPRVGVKLTESGERLALAVLRRHRLIELFLVKTLGMEWHEIHEEAEALEHVVSDRVLERIDELLGNPDFDPHGDPIPSAAGEMVTRDLKPLDECEEGQSARVCRIEDQDGKFLRYLENNELTPGAEISVSSLDGQAGVVSVKFADGHETTLGLPAAKKIQVEICE